MLSCGIHKSEVGLRTVLTAEKLAALRDFLAQLPEGTARRLAQAIEADWRAGGRELPHAVMLEALRPKLQRGAAAKAEPLAPSVPPPPSGALVFTELESRVRAIRNTKQEGFDENMFLENLRSFCELSAGLAKELAGRPEDKWTKRLQRAQAAAADVLEGFIERAPKEILAALPVRKLGSFGFNNPKRLDLSRPRDEDKLEHARLYASLLMRCRQLAATCGIAAAHTAALEETAALLRRYDEDIVREFRAVAAENRGQAQAHLATAMELSNIVLGEHTADRVRQQSRLPISA